MRRSRHRKRKTDDHGRVSETLPINERPATAEDRAVPGHWEGDLLFGTANSPIVTLVECQTRFVMLLKVASKDMESAFSCGRLKFGSTQATDLDAQITSAASQAVQCRQLYRVANCTVSRTVHVSQLNGLLSYSTNGLQVAD